MSKCVVVPLIGVILSVLLYVTWTMTAGETGNPFADADVADAEPASAGLPAGRDDNGDSQPNSMNSVPAETPVQISVPTQTGDQRPKPQPNPLDPIQWTAANNPFASRTGMARLASIIELEEAELGLSLEDQRQLDEIIASMEPSVKEKIEHVRCVPSVCEIVFQPRTPREKYEIPNALVARIDEAEIPRVSYLHWNLPGVEDLYVLYLVREPIIAHLNP